MILKKHLIAIASLAFVSCAYSRGAKPPEREIKVYSIQPDSTYCREAWCQGRVGGVRVQAKEVRSFSQMKNYLAVSPEDFQHIIQTCPR